MFYHRVEVLKVVTMQTAILKMETLTRTASRPLNTDNKAIR